MKTKTIIYKFNPQIYPRNLYVAIGIAPETFREHFEMNIADELFISDLSGDIRGVGIKVIQKYSREIGILMIFKNRDISVMTIAHEASHIADYFYEEIGAYGQEFSDKNEPFAYLVGWAADCIEKAKLNRHDTRL